MEVNKDKNGFVYKTIFEGFNEIYSIASDDIPNGHLKEDFRERFFNSHHEFAKTYENIQRASVDHLKNIQKAYVSSYRN